MIEHPTIQWKSSFWGKNKSTRIYVLIQGILIGLGGMAHGVFETFQGNTPTGGYLISFGIFTMISNYLITGIIAIVVSLAVIIWTIGFIHTRNGPTVFLALCILLFLVGGGVAQVLFFILTWGVSTRINNPLDWWKRVLHEKFRKRLARLWLAILTTDYLVFLTAIGIWLVLSPPTASYRAPTFTEFILWSILFTGVLLQPLTIVSGFARDIKRQSVSPQISPRSD